VGERQGRRWRAAALAAATAASGLQVSAGWSAPRQPSAQALPVVPAERPSAPAPSAAGSGAAAAASPARPGGSLQLRVRRMPDALELVIEGTGAAPQLQQSSSGSGWEGQLVTAQATGLRVGPQRLSLPEVGLQTITLEGSGRSYRVAVTPMPGYPVGRPVVSADGNNLILSFPSAAQATLQTNRLDLTSPGRVPQPAYAPPLQPRAVAPPLGDMAVGSMTLRNPSFVNVSGPRVTLTLNNAPAKDALMSLARIGGYGFVFVDEARPSGGAASSTQPADLSRTVSVAFNNESYATALNTVLLAASLQGKLEGNILFAGSNVMGKGFGPRLSKVYRLNQVSAGSAADYLANLGATVTKTNTVTTATTEGVSQQSAVAGGPNAQTTSQSTTTTVEAYGAASGPLLGLQATTDSRLGTITLVGESSLVAIAEQYLRQLDLRQRQVALSVKILDVTLENDAVTENSFAFRWGNNFIVNDNGQLIGAFGRNLPPRSIDFATNVENVANNSSSSSSSGNQFFLDRSSTRNLTDSQLNEINNKLTSGTGTELVRSTNPETGQVTVEVVPIDNSSTSVIANNVSAIQREISRVLGRRASISRANSSAADSSSSYSGIRRPNPAFNYPKDNFFDFVQSTIESRSTKVLASPTLILGENSEELSSDSGSSSGSGGGDIQDLDSFTIGRKRANESAVNIGERVITDYTVQAGQNGAPNSCQPEFGIAGLQFGARVSKIDDNGFVTFTLSPTITAATRQQRVEGCGLVDILSVRSLDTGSVRVRDGQTLILTGVISDSDIQAVRKWPILGDLPLIGQFFRASQGGRDKRELVVMVTPRIINDEQGGSYGYGYRPETPQAREFMGGR
jgi:type IV pilus assembly protein PilQ